MCQHSPPQREFYALDIGQVWSFSHEVRTKYCLDSGSLIGGNLKITYTKIEICNNVRGNMTSGMCM